MGFDDGEPPRAVRLLRHEPQEVRGVLGRGGVRRAVVRRRGAGEDRAAGRAHLALPERLCAAIVAEVCIDARCLSVA